MKIHEYQAKKLMSSYNIPIPKGEVTDKIDEVGEIFERLKAEKVVVKAQVHAGGRGKAGGIKLANSKEEAIKKAREILGMKLVTAQTGEKGKIVRKILIEEAADIEKEYYIGLTLDREVAKPVLIGSAAGGMEIEEISKQYPELIHKYHIDPLVGVRQFQLRDLINRFEFDKEQGKVLSRIVFGLVQLFLEKDCSLVEINPLILTRDGKVLALDAKINFDDNALYRHPEIMELRDIAEEEPLEVEASKYRLNYIKLNGNIGCMVNGAGLAMATMDTIKLAGGEPANFLDVGGGASEESVTNAFRILISDENVKAVLINIFGGIVRCDRVARGILEAAKKLSINVPIVVRLKGTNWELGQDILKSSGLKFEVADDIWSAAKRVVELAK